jgi:uncharacterized RDD family membrane protein YckC
VIGTAPIARRVLSWLWDYLVIMGWLVLVFVVLGLPQILGWVDLSPIWTDQTAADVGITLLTVLPYFAYLYLTESSPVHATWGKRRAGITVRDRGGSPPTRAAVALRNVVKVGPWQLGHMGTMRLVTASEATTVAIVLQTASLTLLLAVVLPILFRRNGLHDVLARTAVVLDGPYHQRS